MLHGGQIPFPSKVLDRPYHLSIFNRFGLFSEWSEKIDRYDIINEVVKISG